ncbi:5-hydroxytryptamine receptor 3A-like [Hyla sarda]|uniref:5-hydroxytryptamine receptor 3A-like n=1 Tax=Hyla sarda TaxID=327740 RepID=UPI0024C4077B|nr:5-hydroxytryptamine receptor 3A-like [Hyla sarda]
MRSKGRASLELRTASEMQRTFLILMVILFAVTCGQDTCGYYNVTDKIGVLEQSPRLMNIRPVHNWLQPTIVSVDMTFRGVLELDEKLQTMTTLMHFAMSDPAARHCRPQIYVTRSLRRLPGSIWENQFLSWDPEEFCGINYILIPEGSVWVPDINIFEITEDDSIDVLYMQLFYNGTIRRIKTLKVMTTCPLDLNKFPFDIQKCNLTFGTSISKVSDVLLIPSSSAEQVTSLSLEEFSKSEWTLKEINIIHLNITKYGEEWSKVIYQILIRRAPVLYVINLIIPACLLVLVDVASMFIPTEGGERLGFKITVVLGFSVLLLILNDFLPNTYEPPILAMDEFPALFESEAKTNRQLSNNSKESPEIKLLKRLLLELLMVRRHLIVAKKEEEAKSEWHLVAFVLDRFVFILYLLIVTIIIVIVVLAWAM